jgi:mutator protein MutT
VAIGIVVHTGRALICQRRNGGDFGGLWEFPGGKCEVGESPRQCLVRELREELGAEVEPSHALPVLEYDYPTVHVRLHPFLCNLIGGEPRPLESQRLEWADPPALRNYPFPAANAALLEDVIALLSPHIAQRILPASPTSPTSPG